MNQFLNFLFNQPWFFTVIVVWSLFWKGMALWKAATKRHLVWFVLLLIINTFGILEILYIFWLNRWSIDGGRLLKLLEKKNTKK